MKVKYCKDCKWSFPEPQFEWNLKCSNQIVNSNDPWALSSSKVYIGTSCNEERKKKWFSKCGMKGKQWEEKDMISSIKNDVIEEKVESFGCDAKTLKDAIRVWEEEDR